MITYSKIINCNLFTESSSPFSHLICHSHHHSKPSLDSKNSLEWVDNSEEIEKVQKIRENEQCSLVVLESEKMIKSIGIFEFPHITFLYKSAMNPTYAITWKIDTQLNRLYVYFDKNTYVFEREFYDEMIMNKQSITTNTFIVTNIISFIMCKLLEKIFNTH